eukprot:TRINITY_DN454_c6_g1_i1.p1 TRINITY_DN454_c6_g1~~TRINITY_DN454_c6_g1_i1.p1  ORF type:complete len:159 (+),score=19.73 TRINITY_DN454_c6_g1_i1:81-557(+)
MTFVAKLPTINEIFEKIPEDYSFENLEYAYPRGLLIPILLGVSGGYTRNRYQKVIKVHDFLYSSRSNEIYPEITKEVADDILLTNLRKMKLFDHAKAFKNVLTLQGALYYNKKVRSEYKRTNAFETAIKEVNKTNYFFDFLTFSSVFLFGFFFYKDLH